MHEFYIFITILAVAVGCSTMVVVICKLSPDLKLRFYYSVVTYTTTTTTIVNTIYLLIFSRFFFLCFLFLFFFYFSVFGEYQPHLNAESFTTIAVLLTLLHAYIYLFHLHLLYLHIHTYICMYVYIDIVYNLVLYCIRNSTLHNL